MINVREIDQQLPASGKDVKARRREHHGPVHRAARKPAGIFGEASAEVGEDDSAAGTAVTDPSAKTTADLQK